jgi:uracil-DNA glycosylase
MPHEYGTPNFDPSKAIEGDPNSPIWIIGLNPKTEERDHISNSLNPMDWSKTNWNAPHFRRLQGVIGKEWHSCLFKDGGIAHTDLVKCGSPQYSAAAKGAVESCRGFLVNQIQTHKPKLLLILSSDAARIIEEKMVHPEDGSTEGVCQFGDHRCYSSPRQDRYAKQRLMNDFLRACERLSLVPPTVNSD